MYSRPFVAATCMDVLTQALCLFFRGDNQKFAGEVKGV